jgi:hopanoid biosynthesis associated protein HpnK
MAPRTARRRTVVLTADDFGLCPTVNAAVVTAHTAGKLGSAGLMVNEKYADAAVELAQQHPELCVGLHVAASCGQAALPHTSAPAIVRHDGTFRSDPAMAGMAIFFRADARRQIRDEIRLQFDRFEQYGLPKVQVDGHQHLHLHPVVWSVVAHEAAVRGFRWVRIPHEEWRSLPGNGLHSRLEWLFFRVLGSRCRRDARRRGLLTADRVYGHLATNRMDTETLVRHLADLQGDVNEIYLHPGSPLRAHDTELEALMSPLASKAIEDHALHVTNFKALVSLTHKVRC